MEQERVRRCEQAAELLPPRLRRLVMEIPDERKARGEESRLRVRARPDMQNRRPRRDRLNNKRILRMA